MKKRSILAWILSFAMLCSCFSAGMLPASAQEVDGVEFPESLAPGNDANIHDPSIFYDQASGYYYVYSTGMGGDVLTVVRTQDPNMRSWERLGFDTSGLITDEILAVTPVYNIWAPDMVKVGEEYRLYYSCSTGGSGNSCIAMATSDRPDGGFVFQGIVVQSSQSSWGTTGNAIDPCIVTEESTGDRYMTWGSFGAGIFIQKMTEDGFLDQSSPAVNIAYRPQPQNGVEGPYIRYNADTGYYYLFVSYGDLNNNYNVRVARSRSITGPYLDDMGNDMATDSNGSLDSDIGYKLTSGFQYPGGDNDFGAAWMGLGHCSVLEQNGTWILYSHARMNAGGGEYGGLWMQCHQLVWSEEGWPLMVSAFYDGEEEQQVSPGAMVGTFLRIDLSKDDSDLTRTSTEMTFAADGTFTTEAYGDGRWDFTGENTVYCFYDSGRIDQLKVLPGWDQENGRGCYVITGYDQDTHLQVWGKKVSDNYNVAEEVSFTPGWLVQPSQDDLLSHYPLQYDLSDATGSHADGVITGAGYSLDSGVLHLEGGAKATGNYLQLPTGMLDGQDTMTISFWAENENDSGNYAAFFVGSTEANPLNYLLLNPANPSGYVKLAFTDSVSANNAPWETEVGFAASNNATGNSVEKVDGLALYTIVVEGNTLMLYVNGQPAGNAVTLSRTISDLGENLAVYLAASSYGDDLMAGSFRDLQIYDTALNRIQVQQLYGQKEAILAQWALDSIDLEESDALRHSLTLPTQSLGYEITWSTSNPQAISQSGEVFRPAAGSQPATVTLTASATAGNQVLTKDFTFTVLPQQEDINVDAQYYLSLIDLPEYLYTDLALPATTGNQDSITWSSSEEGVLGSDGSLNTDSTQPQTVTLTATLTYGTGSAQKEFPLTVTGGYPYGVFGYMTGTTDLDGSLHLAEVNPEGQVTQLNSGNGVLYADLREVAPNHNGAVSTDTGLYFTSAALARQPESGYLLAVSRSMEQDTVWFYTTTDLVQYDSGTPLTLQEGTNVAKIHSLVYSDSGVQVSWTSDTGESYNTLVAADFSRVLSQQEAQPVTVYAPYALPEGALAETTGVLYLTQEEYTSLTNRLSDPTNNGMEEIPEIHTSAGVIPQMPQSVTATYTDGSTQEFGVQWDLEGIDFTQPGRYTVTGTVEQTQYENPFILYRADPYIVQAEDGSYYFTASYADENYSSYDRVTLRHADTIEGLAEAADVTLWTGNLLWAPEIHYINGQWVMYYATGIKACTRICREGGDPMNPADWGAEIPFDTIPNYNSTSSLDMTYFEVNGTGYVIWAQMGAGNAIQRSTLYMAQLDPNDPSRITGDTITLTTPQYAWEMVNYMVNEGPSVLQKDGKIYVSFSASGTGVEYCMGLLTADADSDLMDPASWSKTGYPVLTSQNVPGEYGPGHNSFTYDEDGNAIFVYHARSESSNSGDTLADSGRHARIKRVHWAADGTPILSMSYEEELAVENRTVTVTIVVEEEPLAQDDLNQDDHVDVLDVMTLAQAAVGSFTLPEGVDGDQNQDGALNVLDVMIFAQRLVSRNR